MTALAWHHPTDATFTDTEQAILTNLLASCVDMHAGQVSVTVRNNDDEITGIFTIARFSELAVAAGVVRLTLDDDGDGDQIVLGWTTEYVDETDAWRTAWDDAQDTTR